MHGLALARALMALWIMSQVRPFYRCFRSLSSFFAVDNEKRGKMGNVGKTVAYGADKGRWGRGG